MNKIKLYYDELSTGIKTMFKEFFNKDTNTKQRANMWTFSRLISAFIIFFLTLIGTITNTNILFLIAFITSIYGATTDFFDGRSARKYNASSDFGKLLDIITDKIFSLMIGISLAINIPLFLFTILGEFTISSINTICQLKYNNINYKSNIIGKIKQWPLSLSFIVGYLSLIIPNLSLVTGIAIGTTSIFQTLALISYIDINIKEIKNVKHNQKFTSLNDIESETDKQEIKKVNTIKNNYKYQYNPENNYISSESNNNIKKYIKKK